MPLEDAAEIGAGNCYKRYDREAESAELLAIR
jgi:hypothetical protein